MTDSINNVLTAALEVLPMLSDEADTYCIKGTDTPEIVSAKIYDAFAYGLDDAQYEALVESARKSTSRAKALATVKEWTDEIADHFEAELDPADMGAQADLFTDFPSLDDAGEDDDVLTVGYAMANWPSDVALPKQITTEIKDAAILPNVAEKLAELFPEEAAKTVRSRRQRRKVVPELNEADKALAALADISDLVGDEPAEADEPVDDNAEAERLAQEEAERLAQEEAEAKAQKEAEEAAAKEAEEKAKKAAEEEAKRKAAAKEAEEKAKKAAEEEAKRKAEEKKAKAEEEAKRKAAEKAKKRSVRTTSISANPYGVVGTMRRILLLDKEIRFDEVALIMADLGVEAKKGTWSPKLSDLRGAYEFFESMGLIDHEQLGKYKTVEDLAKVDDAMDEEYTAKLSAAVDKHVKSKK